MTKSYLLTFDYELFGSGKGCVIRDLIDPTEKILAILKKLNIKATFFVESLEIEAIISLQYKFGKGTKEYKQAVLLKKQLFNIIEEGHDIQLHLHPQWYGAQYINSQWHLNFDFWRFSSLPYYTNENMPGRYDLLVAGKQYLENLIKPIFPEYECIAFRAGGYNIGTDKESITALLVSGFKLDSSVCPGYLNKEGLSQYDFTNAPLDKTFWFSGESITNPQSKISDENQSIIELPLITTWSNIFLKISMARLLNAVKSRKLKTIDYKEVFRLKVDSDRALANSNFDVCLASIAEQRRFKRKVASLNAGERNIVTLIGHPKDFNIFSPLDRILSKVASENFITTVHVVRQVRDV